MDEEQIPQSDNQTEAQAQQPQPVKQSNKLKFWLPVVLAVIIIVGYLVYASSASLWPFGAALRQNQESGITNHEDQIADWQTYRNEEFGFELGYPADWHFRANPYDNSLVLTLDPPEVSPEKHVDTDLPYFIRMGVYSSIAQLDSRGQSVINLADYIDKYSKPDPSYSELGADFEDVEIVQKASINWYAAKAGRNVFGGGEFYFTEDEGRIYKIKLFSSADPEFNRIISTFRFIDSDSGANWKTYRNEDLKFRVQYPGDMVVKQLNPAPSLVVSIEPERNKFSWFEIRTRNIPGQSLENYYYLDFPQSGTGEMGNQAARIFTAPNGYCDGPGCGSPFVAYVTKRGDVFYHIIFYGDDAVNRIESDILESFIFIE